jgi:hypothetical protein
MRQRRTRLTGVVTRRGDTLLRTATQRSLRKTPDYEVTAGRAIVDALRVRAYEYNFAAKECYEQEGTGHTKREKEAAWGVVGIVALLYAGYWLHERFPVWHPAIRAWLSK